MKVLLKTQGSVRLIATTLLALTVVAGCKNDDEGPSPSGNKTVFDLSSVSDPSIAGTVELVENSDNSTTVKIQLTGTQPGHVHPAHIHLNSAAEGGEIAIDLASVDGSTGESVTDISHLNDGTRITYNQLLDFDGHINIHESQEELSTLIAQSDVGQNRLTGNSEEHELTVFSNPEEYDGKITFYERESGESLAVIELEGTTEGIDHPAHIHANTAAEGGGIVISLRAVSGKTGISKTHISQRDNGSAVTYNQLVSFDGYVNVHLSESELASLVAQGDVGQNELTGESVTFDLNTLAIPEISGHVLFEERKNEETLVTIFLEGTSETGSYPAHIHSNTAAEGGEIVIPLNHVDGASGVSKTNVKQTVDGVAITYDDLVEIDGYINVHLSESELSTLVAQGDVGQNALTGEKADYVIEEFGSSGITGTATFYERINGTSLVALEFSGTSDGDLHPAHIHNNSASEGGGIAITLAAVNGTTGQSYTQVDSRDDGTPITYDELINFDGYVNVHLSSQDLSTTLARGNIGANAD